ncbi:MAG: CoA-acylating methylmalonate-semialdehyde dehydrogenase [Calditrichaeota bacterium]|nr:CoA-acylating methylmalonate-semialdehyde dehydrogenase [Candidatus Cloacimonadota bacterium]MCA9786069.1 CoA-acylating methylmalonate-semialdehyde dehydrogenase [Candidatus Cloacimonadota bacterium]MCB1048204.1 CoA-acylating methylmalonate-semialdehyde dehydrogenase [Calditrichota bacterium]MCB9473797.1 CoA-acylating methylmalonate-semialdehyde dehydrogenase [Candidatus Delongbacteria bacterium]
MQLTIKSDHGRLGNWIDDRIQPSTSRTTLPVTSPYTGQTIAEVPLGGSEDVAQAVAAASAAFPGWSTTPIKERVQVMFRLKGLLERSLDELANQICAENGKSWSEARADVLKAIELTEFACALPNTIAGQQLEVSRWITCRTEHAPLGVVASISPFNFPVMVPMWTLPVALTVGNTMILKPSEQVPLSAMRLAELFREAGLPAGVLNVVHGGEQVVNALCDHPGIRALSFVGSTRVARHVYARAAASGKRVLALGGAKNHLILLPDADPNSAPQQIVESAIGCAGQRCMAASVMLAVGDCDALIAEMTRYAQGVPLGSQLGAIINARSLERIEGYITQAEKDGARLLVDGRGRKPADSTFANGWWCGPTLIDGLKEGAPAACEEIFGPVLSILHVDTLEEALRIENSSPYGNACSVFTRSGAPADYVMKHASAGMCGVNVGVPVPREPFAFGGWNESRFGAGDLTGEAGVRFWTQDKKMTVKWIEQEHRNWMS